MSVSVVCKWSSTSLCALLHEAEERKDVTVPERERQEQFIAASYMPKQAGK